VLRHCTLKSLLERWNYGTCSRPRALLFHINNFYYCDLMPLKIFCTRYWMGQGYLELLNIPEWGPAKVLPVVPRACYGRPWPLPLGNKLINSIELTQMHLAIWPTAPSKLHVAYSSSWESQNYFQQHEASKLVLTFSLLAQISAYKSAVM